MTCVRVTREHHPLQDHSLQVLGQMHCCWTALLLGL
jgi:hypothetical protein